MAHHLGLINDEDTARFELAWHREELRGFQGEIRLEKAQLANHRDDPEQYEVMKPVCEQAIQHFMNCIGEYHVFIDGLYSKFETLRPRPSRIRSRSRSPVRKPE